MAKGGARPGAGRKPKAAEQKTAALCRAALAKMYGNDAKVIMAMMQTGEPSLMKFILEHAYGKPVEKVAKTDPEGNEIPSPAKQEIDYSSLPTVVLEALITAQKHGANNNSGEKVG